MGKWVKRLLGAGVIAGAVYALWRAIDQRTQESDLTWTPQPFPSPPKPVPNPSRAVPQPAVVWEPDPGPEPAAWVEPTDGACPASHPVKAKLSSGIFHPPDGQLYERTIADRCYRDAASAEADGLRASKR